MGTKLGKDTLPSGHGPDDFECFGPPATKDGDFQNVKIADFGCFKQGETDSNKYYAAQIAKSRKNGKWYVYFEWGRVGASKPSFQVVECSSESDAQEEFVDQCRSKNDKRGQWITIGSIKTLEAKPGKDCYLVRPMATRSVGLPDGRKIKLNDGAKQLAAPAKTALTTTTTIINTPTVRVDPQTISLMRDLNLGTISYAKSAIVGAALPSQSAIDEGRTLLIEAEKRVLKVGDSIQKQVADKDLLQITSVLYSRIPKIKPVNAGADTWILSQNNIMSWRQDLDAFESALYASDMADSQNPTQDPFGGIRMHMEYIDPTTKMGKFLYKWWPAASGNRHSYVGNMKIRNMWRIERTDDHGKVSRWQDIVANDKVRPCERPLYQPDQRWDIEDDKERTKYHNTNTSLLFHGTRSVNVSGIMRESWRLPKQLVGVQITGAMFGGGVYWADDWRKSDGYTSRSGSYFSSGSGGIRNRGAFMFGADVVLGNPWVAPQSGGYIGPKPGPRGEKTHCIFGKMGYSGVQNNEWIVFEKNQMSMKYLVEYEAN